MPEYRRRLPHLEYKGAQIFLTWRLKGSLPVCARHPILTGADFVANDRELDCQTAGPRWLAKKEIAQLVAQTILAGESERRFYKLHAWVMPNHVHMLITPTRALSTITRWIKGSTVRRANSLLGLTGRAFWQDESWDRWIRSGDEFRKTVRYIEFNPVAAGLIRLSDLWLWSSASGQAEPPVPRSLPT